MDAKIWVLLLLVNIVRSRDIIVGSKDNGHKIYDENKQAGPAIWRQMENITIAANDTEVISKIVITDLRAEKDGDAQIVEGGEGQNNVTIELKSPTVLRGYEFHIEVYAIPSGQQKTAQQNSGTTENTIPKERSNEASTPNSSSTATPMYSSTTILNKSTTQGAPTNDVNIRQNRDTENKDKSVHEVKINTPSLPNTVSTTEISKTTLTNTPKTTLNYDMKTQVSDQNYPTVNREVEQKQTFGHPRVHIYEVSEMSKSTDTNIASTTSKVPDESIHTRGVQTNINDGKNVQSNSDKLYTHIEYPQFGDQDSKQSPDPVTNTALPIVAKDGKDKNLRHKRDVSHPITEKNDESKSIAEDSKANTAETKLFNNQAQEHNDNNEQSTTETKLVNSKQTQDNTFRNQHSYRRFKNTANVSDRDIMSSTEVTKISTPLSKVGESTQSVGKFNIYSRPQVIGGQLSTTTINPSISVTTDKSGSSTEKLGNPSIQPKVSEANHDKPHDIKVLEEVKRGARDTASINKEDKTEAIVPPVLRSFSTTLKPEINSKDSLGKNVGTPDTAHGNLNIPEDNHSTDAKSGITTIPAQNEEDRNHPSKIGLGISSTLNTPSSNSNKHVGNVHTTKQQKTESPKPSTTTEAHKISEVKERQTRDTSSGDKSVKQDKKVSSTEKTVSAESETKLQQNLTNLNKEKSFNLKTKVPTPSSTANDKIGEEDAKKVDEIKTYISINNGQQLPKIPRQAKLNEAEESKQSNSNNQHSNVGLATGLRINSKDKPTSIEPVIKEKDEKKGNKPE